MRCCRLSRVEAIVQGLAHDMGTGARMDLPEAMQNVDKLRGSLAQLQDAELLLQHQVLPLRGATGIAKARLQCLALTSLP